MLTYVGAFEDVDLSILGDPTRRAIFELLARRPCSVGELADHLPITRQAVSQHLRVLKDGGLVVVTPEGTRRIYRLNPDGVAVLQAYFQHMWDQALTAFQKAADAATAKLEQEQ
jgi:DNA-binding transcriptional ArsR family regulator